MAIISLLIPVFKRFWVLLLKRWKCNIPVNRGNCDSRLKTLVWGSHSPIKVLLNSKRPDAKPRRRGVSLSFGLFNVGLPKCREVAASHPIFRKKSDDSILWGICLTVQFNYSVST